MSSSSLSLRSSSGKHILVDQTAQISIGRDPHNDVVINDGGVSRRHAALHAVAGQLEIRDEGSANGTFVNGHRVAHATRLRVGDEVKIGSERFVVEAAAAAPLAGFQPAAVVPEYAPVHPVRPMYRRRPSALVPVAAIGGLAVVAAIAVMLFMARPLQPDEAARSWLSALATQDVQQLSELTCLSQQNSIQATSAVVGLGSLFGTSLDVGGMQFQTTRTSGNQADVHVTGSVKASFGPFSTARRLDLNIRMQQEDGKWRYCDNLQRIASQIS